MTMCKCVCISVGTGICNNMHKGSSENWDNTLSVVLEVVQM